MAASYRHYYFIPQLSVLSYGQEPPISSPDFREKAAPMLDAGDASLMEEISLGFPPEASGDGKPVRTGCDFVDGLREWEKSLRLNLARLRASAAGREEDSLPEAPDWPSDAVEAAARAVGAETPLEGEAVIDRARWDAVEALQGGELFHRRTVFAYFAKLLILERQASFQAEAGFSQYKSLYDSILGRWDGESSGARSMGESR